MEFLGESIKIFEEILFIETMNSDSILSQLEWTWISATLVFPHYSEWGRKKNG